MNFWERMILNLRDIPTVKFGSLQELENFKWIEFKEGVLIRVIPTGLKNIILLECTMEANVTVGEHIQDYIERFIILKGEVKDLTSKVVMKADGKIHSWTIGTPHNPHSLTKSHLLIVCELP